MSTASNGKKVVLITGGSRGIGSAISEAFAKDGYNVAFNFMSNKEKAEEVEKRLKEYSDCRAYQADVSKSDDVEKMVASVKEKFGQIDVLINNAGVMANALFSFITEEDWDRVFSVHVKGTYLCSKMVSRVMVEQRYGTIINIASISAFKPLVGQSNYAAAKGGIVTLTKSLAKELCRWNIRSNCIAPGYIQTDMIENDITPEMKQFIKNIPLGRVGTPEEVADLALFLASDKSRYINGETIKIDGGLSI